MKTTADAVRDYLSAVEREASTLPADRRQELLADLAEHIEVTRAERPDTPLGEILAELGDPRAIAATALTEAGYGTAGAPGAGGAGAPARRGKVHPLVPLLLVTLSIPAMMAIPVFFGTLIGFLARVVGAVFLCTSVHWTAAQKAVGVTLTAVLPTAVIVAVNVSNGATDGGPAAVLPNLVITAVIAAASAWLWRVRRA